MLLLALALAASTTIAGTTTHPVADVVPNDNRIPAGRLDGGVLTLRVVAEDATFYPETKRGPGIAVYAFAEEGSGPTVPGPLIRVPAGTEIRVFLRNALATPLCVRGLQDHTTSMLDTVDIAAGATREVRFRANSAGTFIYWARATQDGTGFGWSQDSQLTGAFIVDPPNTKPRADERIMVMTLYADTLDQNGHEVRREPITINGVAWPWTERLTYTVGDTVRWRVLNATIANHPMHLHGFYFDVTSKGDTTRDTVYTPVQRRKAVTEMLTPGATMSVAWIPTRPGNWLFHCHLIYHIDASRRLADAVPVGYEHNHAFDGMSGLVMAIQVAPAHGAVATAPDPIARRRIYLFIDERPNVFGDRPGYAFVLQRDSMPPAVDSAPSPSSTLVLHRNEPTEIVVVNRLQAGHASIHWHGIELESFYDGVGGWSGAGDHLAPVIAPGDSFVVRMTPDRAGTFIYHTHVDEGKQLTSGLYGPLIVLAEGAAVDTTDRIFLIGDPGPTDTPRLVVAPFINGSTTPPPLELRAGTTHRIRFVSISGAFVRRVRLISETGIERWRAVAKDGADLPLRQATMRNAQVDLGPGETADFEVRRDKPEVLTMEIVTAPAQKRPHLMKIPVIVR
ncbi:MAG: multicopper oxidase domain-containing protein [Gemmatimonadaceae bacterium]